MTKKKVFCGLSGLQKCDFFGEKCKKNQKGLFGPYGLSKFSKNWKNDIPSIGGLGEKEKPPGGIIWGVLPPSSLPGCCATRPMPLKSMVEEVPQIIKLKLEIATLPFHVVNERVSLSGWGHSPRSTVEGTGRSTASARAAIRALFFRPRVPKAHAVMATACPDAWASGRPPAQSDGNAEPPFASALAPGEENVEYRNTGSEGKGAGFVTQEG